MTIYAGELDLHFLMMSAEPTEKGRNQAASQSQAVVIMTGRIKSRFGANQLQWGDLYINPSLFNIASRGGEGVVRVLLLRSPTWLEVPSRSHGSNVQGHHATAHGVLRLCGLHQAGPTEGMVS
jgi:hypothetical protein